MVTTGQNTLSSDLLVKLVANELDVGEQDEELGREGQFVVHSGIGWIGDLRVIGVSTSSSLVLLLEQVEQEVSLVGDSLEEE